MSKHRGDPYWNHSDPNETPPVAPSSPCVGRHPNIPDDQYPPREVGLLCHDCYRRLRHNVTHLPALVTWLEVNIAAGSSSALDDQRVTGGGDDAPIPLRLDVLDLTGPYAPDPGLLSRDVQLEQQGDPSILDCAGSWALLVNEEHKTALPTGRDLTSLTGYLAANLLWIADQLWVDEFCEEIASILRRASRVAPWRPERRRVKDEACDQCGMRALITHVAEGVTVCDRRTGGCGHRRPVTDYAFNARHLDTA